MQVMSSGVGVYRQRKPKESSLWKCMHDHFLTFVSEYEMEYEKTCGYYRPIITEVVESLVISCFISYFLKNREKGNSYQFSSQALYNKTLTT